MPSVSTCSGRITAMAPEKTAAEKKAEAAVAEAAVESAKETEKTKKEGVYRLDQGESLP